MKKLLIFLITPLLVFAQDVTMIPDQNFEQALIDLGHDQFLNGYVATEKKYIFK